VAYPDLSVEQGIRIFLTGGMAFSPRMTTMGDGSRPAAAGD
jgi:hypothetical protein